MINNGIPIILWQSGLLNHDNIVNNQLFSSMVNAKPGMNFVSFLLLISYFPIYRNIKYIKPKDKLNKRSLDRVRFFRLKNEIKYRWFACIYAI